MDRINAQVVSLSPSKKGGNSTPYWKSFSPLILEGKIPLRTDNCLKSRKESTELYTVSFHSGKAVVVMILLGSVLGSVFFNIYLYLNNMKKAKKWQDKVFR